MNNALEPMLGEGAVETGPARYRVLMPLGRGGMAEVLLAEAVRKGGFRKLVVLKRLLPDVAADVQMRSGFLREAELSARLNHPNVVQVHEVHEEEGQPALVMEFLDGMTLSEVLSRLTEPFPLRLHIHVLCQALAGLHYFHELCDYDGSPLNAVHRDVSPQNVMLLFEGAVKVLDFGIAKQMQSDDGESTAIGVVKGKLHYMPTEQLTSPKSITRAADIFAVGVMLWEAVTGRRLWKGMGQGQVMQALVAHRIPSLLEVKPDVDPELERIVAKALQCDPKERWPTALAFEEALGAYLEKLGGMVQPREMARFMAEHFGGARAARHQAIDLATKGARTSSSTTTTSTGTRIIAGAERSISFSISHSEPVSSRRTAPIPMQWWALALILAGVGVAAAGVTLLVLRVGRAPAPVVKPIQATATRVEEAQLSIAVAPPTATLTIDERQVPNPYVATRPVREQLRIRAEATGYRSEERIVEVAPGNIVINLEPVPSTLTAVEGPSTDALPPMSSSALAGAPEAKPSVPALANPAPSASSVRRAPKPTAPSSSKTVSAACDPPFTFAADGVKVYKPECL